MLLRWILLSLVLITSVSKGLACARTTNPVTTTTVSPTTHRRTTTSPSTTTTTAPTTCAQRTNAALLAGSFTVASTFFGAVSPVGQCTSCKAGQASYYPDSGIVTPMAQDQKAIGGLTCANLCVCSANGVCYTRTDNNVNVVLYPYCNAGSCSVYAIVIAQNDNSGLMGTDGSVVTVASQIDPVTINRLPVTSGKYPMITLASCNGCSSPTTC